MQSLPQSPATLYFSTKEPILHLTESAQNTYNKSNTQKLKKAGSMDLKLKVKHTIEEYEMIKKGQTVVLGLSGGPDSLCLLHILYSLQKSLDFKLSAIHVNHMIRGEAADADQAFVQEYCEKLNVPLKVYKLDIPAIAKEKGISDEQAGREARHQLLRDAGADRIALAHNKNDQAETVFMRILRGTGVKGLAAMDFVRQDGIIRPLLGIEREEIENYCRENNLQPRIDLSNFENDYTRNKIRNELLPILKEYNPAIIDSLSRLAESAKDDERNEFAKVVVTAFSEAGLKEDIGAVHINALYKAAKKNVGGKIIEFPHGYKAVIKNGKVWIEKPDK